MIIAFLDSTASARPVLEAALGMAEVLGVEVRAVHVQATGSAPARTPAAVAAGGGLDLAVVRGPVPSTVLVESSGEEVDMAVMGARATTAGRRPVGSVTRHVIERCARPVLIVPPEAVASRPLRRALVPLDGTVPASSALEAWVPRLAAQMALIGLHVFTPGTAPPMLDRPGRDLVMLADSFQERHLPVAARMEMRSGHAAGQIVGMIGERRVDLVVLSWSQPREPGRAQTLLQVLSMSPVPTLLLPWPSSSGADCDRHPPAETARVRSGPAVTRQKTPS